MAPEAPLPPHITRIALSRRAWNGARVDSTEFWGDGEVFHEMPFESHAHLSCVLEDVGGGACEPRFVPARRCPIDHVPRHLYFAPAGTRVWGYTKELRYAKDATVVFDVAALEERLGARVSSLSARPAQIRFTDDRLWSLLQLLAQAIHDPDPSAELYGDGLVAALVATVVRDATPSPHARRGLAPWQLRRVQEYLDAHLAQPVALADLARLTQLSQPHFARAFKASTGLPPHRYQLQRRIERAQVMLVSGDGSLEEVAVALGFVDAAHFGRVFRARVGVTPGAWRRDRRR